VTPLYPEPLFLVCLRNSQALIAAEMEGGDGGEAARSGYISPFTLNRSRQMMVVKAASLPAVLPSVAGFLGLPLPDSLHPAAANVAAHRWRDAAENSTAAPPDARAQLGGTQALLEVALSRSLPAVDVYRTCACVCLCMRTRACLWCPAEPYRGGTSPTPLYLVRFPSTVDLGFRSTRTHHPQVVRRPLTTAEAAAPGRLRGSAGDAQP
jgi:hypothetical protein